MTSAQKLKFALLLNVALIAALLTTCGSCVSTWRYQHAGRTVAEQSNAGVTIKVTCHDHAHFGSGVIVSGDRILTANHVAQCSLVAGLPIYVPPVRVTVDPGDGVERLAEVELSFGDEHKDIARLRLINGSLEEYFSPISIGAQPALGDKVCEASMVPRPTYRCGMAQHKTSTFINMEMRTEHGNSGSGLYNEYGQLIGIVVQWWPCEKNEMCGGRAAPLQGLSWLVPNH